MQKNLIAGLEELPMQVKSLTSHKHHIDESEHRYRQILEGLPAAIYTCDAHGRILQYNEAAASLWGREPEIGNDVWCGSWKIYKTDGTPLPLDSCPMAIALKEGRAVNGHEIVVERPDGVRRNVLPHPKPIFDSTGKVVGAVNMLVDITDHKHAELALRESEERFRTLADQAPIIIWMSDENNNAVYLNSKWCEFTGLHKEKGYGHGWVDIIHPEDREKTYREWEYAFQKREPFDSKFRYRNAKNEYCIIKANCSPRINILGEFLGYIGILNDVTLQENAQSNLETIVEERTRDLIKANTELERSNLELEQFAYVASHDLQEPLRKIQAFSDMLQKKNEEKLNEESKIFLNKIMSSANRLSVLIEELLNFSRLSRPTGLFIKTNPNEIWNKVKTDFELEIMKKQAVINSETLQEMEAIPLQLNQLFQNLLSNSLKFSSPERPTVINVRNRKLSKEEINNHPELQNGVPHCEITFQDNGIGFQQEYAEQIFLIFQRLHGQYNYKGSGIGLALCRKIVSNHRGKIFAEGVEGEGACFHIILPESQLAKKL